MTAEWGNIVAPEAIEEALKSRKKIKMLALVHAETSTGVMQPLAEASKLAKQYGALFMVDTVTSLAGQEVAVDDWGIDICYSGTQKCISCPPGLAPFTVNQKALDIMQSRKAKGPSWYLDLGPAFCLLGNRAHLSPHRAGIHDLRAARGTGIDL